jgi:hypothetical protein
MEMAENIGVVGFDVLWQGEVISDWAKAAPPQKEMKPAGPERPVVGIY